MESKPSPDPSNAAASAGERRLARLVVPAPSAYEPHQRIDWMHDPPSPADVYQGATETTTAPVVVLVSQTRELGLPLDPDGCCG